MSDIQTVLAEIQQKLNAPKGQTNTFGNYKYRSCEDILEAVKPLLGQSILTISDDIVMLGDRFYIKAVAKISLGSESISANGFAREAENKKGMDSSQLTGATSSYARKYALNGLFLIDDNKDADSNESNQQSSGMQSAAKNVPQIVKDVPLALDHNDAAWVKANWGAITPHWGSFSSSQQERLNNLINQ